MDRDTDKPVWFGKPERDANQGEIWVFQPRVLNFQMPRTVFLVGARSTPQLRTCSRDLILQS